MTVTFYSVEDDPRVVTKTLGTATLTLNNVKLKNDTDVINPVLELGNNTNLLGSNYFYIQEFGRYYNVTDQKTNSLGFFVTGHVDVLKSWDSDIRGLNAIIARNQNKQIGNAYLKDERMPILEKQQVILRTFENISQVSGFCKQGYESLIMIVNGPRVSSNQNSGNNQGGGE